MMTSSPWDSIHRARPPWMNLSPHRLIMAAEWSRAHAMPPLRRVASTPTRSPRSMARSMGSAEASVIAGRRAIISAGRSVRPASVRTPLAVMIPAPCPCSSRLDRGRRSPDPGRGATLGLWNRLLFVLLLAERAVTVGARLLVLLVRPRRLGPGGPLVGDDPGEVLRRPDEVVHCPGPVLRRVLPRSGRLRAPRVARR